MTRNLSDAKWRRFVIAESIRSLITEGLGDIGLADQEQDLIRSKLPDANEKTQTFYANVVKDLMSIPNYDVRMRWLVPASRLIASTISENSNLDQTQKDEIVGFLESAMEAPLKDGVTGYKNVKKFVKSIKSIFTKLIPKRYIPNYIELFQDEVGQLLTQLDAATFDAMNHTINMMDPAHTVLNKDPDFAKEIMDAYDKAGATLGDSNRKPELTNRIQSFVRGEAESELGALEISGEVMKRYADGTYWYDTQATSCSFEKAKMGHCGNAAFGGGIVSLRYRPPVDPNKPDAKPAKYSKPYVTLEWDGDDTISQVKGTRMINGERAANVAPPETVTTAEGVEINLWEKIADFFQEYNVERYTETGHYSSHRDTFEEMNEYLEAETGLAPEDKTEQLVAEMDAVEERYQLDYFTTQYEIEDWDGDEPYAYWGGDGRIILNMKEAFEDYPEQMLQAYFDRIDDDTIMEWVKDMLESISPYNWDIDSYSYGHDFDAGITTMRASPDSPMEHDGYGADGYDTFLRNLQDVEGRYDDMASDIVSWAIDGGHIEVATEEFKEFGVDALDDFAEDLKHLARVDFDEDVPDEGIQFFFAQDWPSRKGFLVMSDNDIAELQNKYAGPAVPRTAFDDYMDRALDVLRARTTMMIRTMIKNYSEKYYTTKTGQEQLPFAEPVSDKPYAANMYIDIDDDDAFNLGTTFYEEDDGIRLMVKFKINAIVDEDQLENALMIAKYLDSEMPKILDACEKYILAVFEEFGKKVADKKPEIRSIARDVGDDLLESKNGDLLSKVTKFILEG
jgi:hypothetical protein